MDDLRFPLGKFEIPKAMGLEQRETWLRQIDEAPAQLREAVADLNDAQLDTIYRPEGWTIRQVVHHLPDSHMNSYIRFRLALTEDEPTILGYHEERWARLDDAQSGPLALSLDLLEALHIRWVALLRSLSPEQYKRRFVHPENGKLTLGLNLAFYAWHGRHHIAHITSLRDRKGWS